MAPPLTTRDIEQVISTPCACFLIYRMRVVGFPGVINKIMEVQCLTQCLDPVKHSRSVTITIESCYSIDSHWGISLVSVSRTESHFSSGSSMMSTVKMFNKCLINE